MSPMRVRRRRRSHPAANLVRNVYVAGWLGRRLVRLYRGAAPRPRTVIPWVRR